jgi:hypothetical protein
MSFKEDELRAGYAARMLEMANIHRNLFGKPEGKRAVGRPWRRRPRYCIFPWLHILPEPVFMKDRKLETTVTNKLRNCKSRCRPGGSSDTVFKF